MIEFTNMLRAGYLPQFFSEADPRPAREQAHESYVHGGGWIPFKGFELINEEPASILYPGDPPVREVSRGHLRDETIILFQHSWVAIVQPTGEYEIARMD